MFTFFNTMFNSLNWEMFSKFARSSALWFLLQYFYRDWWYGGSGSGESGSGGYGSRGSDSGYSGYGQWNYFKDEYKSKQKQNGDVLEEIENKKNEQEKLNEMHEKLDNEISQATQLISQLV